MTTTRGELAFAEMTGNIVAAVHAGASPTTAIVSAERVNVGYLGTRRPPLICRHDASGRKSADSGVWLKFLWMDQKSVLMYSRFLIGRCLKMNYNEEGSTNSLRDGWRTRALCRKKSFCTWVILKEVFLFADCEEKTSAVGCGRFSAGKLEVLLRNANGFFIWGLFNIAQFLLPTTIFLNFLLSA